MVAKVNSDPVPVGRNCPLCKKLNTVVVERQDFIDWHVNGKYVQKAFPYLSADEREILVSGTCKGCWEKLFK